MAMRRFNFMIDPELDELLESEARRRSMSKGAVIRELVRERLGPRRPIEEDSIWQIVGMAGDVGEADWSSRVDEVVYDLDRE
jgi:hypothetical protein